MQIVIAIVMALGLGWFVESKQPHEPATKIAAAPSPSSPAMGNDLAISSAEWERRCAARFDRARRELREGSTSEERDLLARRQIDFHPGDGQGLTFQLGDGVFVAGVVARRMDGLGDRAWYSLDGEALPDRLALVRYGGGRTGFITSHDASSQHRGRLVTLFRSAIDDCLAAR